MLHHLLQRVPSCVGICTEVEYVPENDQKTESEKVKGTNCRAWIWQMASFRVYMISAHVRKNIKCLTFKLFLDQSGEIEGGH